MAGRRLSLWLVGAAAIAWPGPGAAGADLAAVRVENQRCYNCHAQEHIAALGPGERLSMTAEPTAPAAGRPATRPELHVWPQAMAGTVHEALTCVSCHGEAAALPHAAELGPATCNSGCHQPAGDAFRRGAHAVAAAEGDPLAPNCTTCHGGHEMLPHNRRDSQLHPLNIVGLCGDCHAQHTGPTTNGHDGPDYVQSYLESVHGRAVTESGLAVAATCVDCHGSHEVLAATDPASPIHRARVADTCGRCHVGINETFAMSIHGELSAGGDARAPVCTDCHTAHAITHADTPGFELDIVAECGQCHNEPTKTGALPYATYRRSYHGQVASLGSGRAARCSDCHGAHDILPADDARSRTHERNLVRTCAQCHKNATASFVQFQPHADYRDGERYPLLHAVWLYFIIVMSVTFGFFGLHSILWFVRSSVHHARHGRGKHYRHVKRSVRRFNRVDRINHAFVIVTFFGLTLTGMPLFFADQAWARGLVELFGGVRGAGILHRVFAVMLIGNFLVHGWEVFRRVQERGARGLLLGPNSMLPRWKDVTDCLGMFRWFFGGRRKPRFDHFTYWEKFDYWAEIFGTLVIGGTGLMLWFPELFARVMPGWMFNVAMVVHGYEALLAVGFIFTIHFFNAHLRWEKFPVDDVMFTGSLPEAEFREERPVEYERLAQAGGLAELLVEPAPRWQRRVAVAAGVTAMLVGTTLVVLIILGGLGLL